MEVKANKVRGIPLQHPSDILTSILLANSSQLDRPRRRPRLLSPSISPPHIHACLPRAAIPPSPPSVTSPIMPFINLPAPTAIPSLPLDHPINVMNVEYQARHTPPAIHERLTPQSYFKKSIGSFEERYVPRFIDDVPRGNPLLSDGDSFLDGMTFADTPGASTSRGM